MILDKYVIISPEFGLEKGGIQTWAYYIYKLLKERAKDVSSFGVRELSILSIGHFFRTILFANKYILMTWKMSLFIYPLLYWNKKTFYIFIHGNDFLNLNFIYDRILKHILSRNNVLVISNSNFITNLFENHYKYKADLTCYPFIDTHVNMDIDNDERDMSFFTVTRLVRRKNIHSVIRAIYELSLENVHVKYYIAGEGPEKEYLKKLVVSFHLEDSVIFLGKISEKEKEIYLKRVSYFILPSLFDEKNASIEGYGIVYIEANLYGLPVISGNTGGMPEAVINNVTGLVTDGSVSEIKDAIIKIQKMKYDKKAIISFARKHDYRSQNNFWILITK
ncbi:glycosyltransferase family 4 protein [Phocaeicola vulgatus]|uniref:glycosyltransferase family 4 protein n=1 Tax=Phocaeicola vulgatus TaxID=821 RepID=UPI0023075174|nr:glycosyltransferase family 4 protein [Phocaeicola vulgatus]MDB0862771.1 glycosyltransferase family 4 protein [Phocaeicola vulgatus]MDB0863931.1 glycosyltransferase family 4 protein [Phocaeicola vulgatus]MDB0868082.1 glycosyltransferase family 4 protein [Phocaeicola vulgatus]MDB0885194.1 glycosyltransferase family 4 protein [Phocaeicola vulgatus]